MTSLITVTFILRLKSNIFNKQKYAHIEHEINLQHLFKRKSYIHCHIRVTHPKFLTFAVEENRSYATLSPMNREISFAFVLFDAISHRKSLYLFFLTASWTRCTGPCN